MPGIGFAVVDVETTGFSPARGDRMVEIAIVHLSPSGEVEGLWETLLNPMRDVGPTHIHGISAKDVARAPQFPDIGARVLNLLSDRVVVAHNLEFDMRFLSHETKVVNIRQLSGESSIRFSSICTMQL